MEHLKIFIIFDLCILFYVVVGFVRLSAGVPDWLFWTSHVAGGVGIVFELVYYIRLMRRRKKDRQKQG